MPGPCFGPRKNIFHGTQLKLVEGPHLYKRDGWYYLTTAEGGTGYAHACTFARSRTIEGPYALQRRVLGGLGKLAYDLGIPTMRVNTGRWGTSASFDELMTNRGIEPPLEELLNDPITWLVDPNARYVLGDAPITSAAFFRDAGRALRDEAP